MSDRGDLKIVPVPTTLHGEAQRTTNTRVEVLEITRALAESWKNPSFQRQLKVNERIMALAREIKETGILPGILTLGVLAGKTYVIDGQHRLSAFAMSEIDSAYADVRIMHFETAAAMGEEFVKVNSMLVRMKPDDILRGLESAVPGLQKIRGQCPFVGYDSIRRGEHNPIVSMSIALKTWRGSLAEVPVPNISAQSVAMTLTDEEAEALIAFLRLAFSAWGRDTEYARLWTALNLSLCMWLYRRVVLGHDMSLNKKRTVFSRAMFEKCLSSLSANGRYLDWLLGRLNTERDRGPCYERIRLIIGRRYSDETKKKAMFPRPAWCAPHGPGGGRAIV